MKPRYFLVLASLLVVSLIQCVVITTTYASKITENTSAQYSVGMMKVCGTALAIGGSAEEIALKDAKKKAVKKAVARFIAPSEDANSLYQQIVVNYDDYLGGEVKILKKQNIDGKILLFCNVPIDFQKINNSLKEKVGLLQKKNRRDKAIFLVRIANMPIPEKEISYNILTQYEEAFKLCGFRVLGSDTACNSIANMLEVINSMNEISEYAVYKNEIINDITQIPELSLGVIGEIRITRNEQYGNSAYVEAECYVEVIKLEQDGYIVIGSFMDNYSSTRNNIKDALNSVTQAASVKSSKFLADMVYKYWQ